MAREQRKYPRTMEEDTFSLGTYLHLRKIISTIPDCSGYSRDSLFLPPLICIKVRNSVSLTLFFVSIALSFNRFLRLEVKSEMISMS